MSYYIAVDRSGNQELTHWGILGMKWGRRRYQNPDGSLTSEGKERYGSGGDSSSRHSPSAARKRAKAEAAAEAIRREREAAKKKALESGNATDVLKYKGELSNKELQDAFNRITLERNLASISAQETAKGKAAIDKFIDWTVKMKDRGNKVVDVYNFIAKIRNSFADEDEMWIKIGENNKSKAEREREQAEKAEKKRKEAQAEEEAKKEKERKEANKRIELENKRSAIDFLAKNSPSSLQNYDKLALIASMEGYSTKDMEKLLKKLYPKEPEGKK